METQVIVRIGKKLLCLSGLLIAWSAGFAQAQSVTPPLRSELVKSMGQPVYWKPYFGPSVVWDRHHTSKAGAQLSCGLRRDLLAKAVEGFGLAAEGYYTYVDDEGDGGIRLAGIVPFIGLGMGTDYSFDAEEFDFFMSFQFPWRRSGPLGLGDNFRIDYYPTRGHSLALGLSVPIFQPWAGKTRPQRDTVELPARVRLYDPVYTPSAEIRDALAVVRETANQISHFTIPYLDVEAAKDEKHMKESVARLAAIKAFIQSRDETFPEGHSFAAVVDVYHRHLERAFVLATGGDEQHGRMVAARARRYLRDEVVFPYNRLLGQRKRHDSLVGLGTGAEGVFKEWLVTTSDVPPPDYPAVMYVFEQLIKAWEEYRKSERDTFGDSRLVWIPLHFVIKPEEADSQEELDEIIEAAVEQPFSDANEVHYVINELFQPELYRMIHAALEYHVLWIHDYRGRNSAGDPDKIGYAQTVFAYLSALVDRVREYEETRKIPVYMIFLDQIFYESNDGRLWLTLLENPLGCKMNLPKGYEEWEAQIETIQTQLREAVAASPTLQAGRREYGDGWLENLIKVQVNITNVADMSFRSNHLIRWVPNLPDAMLRDHRKISFYDVSELDPGRGEAIFTGMGVGEHYAGPTWDDRAILVRGPSLIHLKDEARKLLTTQGFEESEIPLPLRPLPRPDNYDDMLASLRTRGWTTTTLQVYNATGYGMKWSNVLKATVYNLMPRGTRMMVPDSLWNSMLWGGMMVGAALRGCWVFPISPALECAPSDGVPQMSRANEVFTAFLLVQNNLQEEIAQAGGMFRVGIYDPDYDVADSFNNIRHFENGVARSETFRKVFPFDQSVFEMAATLEDSLHAWGYETAYLTGDAVARKPKLHQKTQFFASQEAVQSLLTLEEWQPLVLAYVKGRLDQARVRETKVSAKEMRHALSEKARPLFERWRQTASPEQKEKTFFYLTVGSHNMDLRGMFMDGEALVVVAGADALLAYMDFVGIAARTTWLTSIEQLNEMLPAQKGFGRSLGRFIKNAL